MDEMLDEKDLTLIEELKGDSKLSEKGLARKTGIPMTTVHNRLRKLRGLGVIRGYTIRLDYAKLGRPLSAYILIKAVAGANPRGLLARISRLEHVCETSMIAGSEFDIVFRVRAASIDELNRMMMEDIKGDSGVGDIRALISYETIESD